MDGWNTTFLLRRPIFRGYVTFRGCISSSWLLAVAWAHKIVNPTRQFVPTKWMGLIDRTAGTPIAIKCNKRHKTRKMLDVLQGQGSWKSTTLKLPIDYLGGGFNPLESNWIISPSRGENKKCLKPPPRLWRFLYAFCNMIRNEIVELQGTTSTFFPKKTLGSWHVEPIAYIIFHMSALRLSASNHFRRRSYTYPYPPAH